MLPEQQRILGYFIEEAGDHLNTIEQGLLNLQGTISDPEMLNEVFRAAHSVKGGSAMLGLGSIQRVAHRLEDSFKRLKETPVQVDQQLESLFLRVFDALQELLDQLQGQGGLTESAAAPTLSAVEPVFEQLDRHLDLLESQEVEETVDGSSNFPITAQPITSTTPTFSSNPDEEESAALELIFQSDVLARLREMLQLFKQPETPESREQLGQLCRLLATAGSQFDLVHWSQLLQAAESAIANPNNTFSSLASVLIREIKQAQELVLANRSDEIVSSSKLQGLLPPKPQPEDDFDDLLVLSAESQSFEKTLALDGLESLDSVEDDGEDDLSLLNIAASDSQDFKSRNTTRGPEVGMAELTSLADLFEGEAPELEAWEEEGSRSNPFSLDLSESLPEEDLSDSDFAEFMLEEEDHSKAQVTPEEDLTELFGYNFDEEEAHRVYPEVDLPEPTPRENFSALPETEQLSELFEEDLFSELPKLTQENGLAHRSEAAEADNEWEGLWGDSDAAVDETPEGEESPLKDAADLDEFLAHGTLEPSNLLSASENLSFEDLFGSEETPVEAAPETADSDDWSLELFAGEPESSEIPSPSGEAPEDPLEFFDLLDWDSTDSEELEDLSQPGQALEDLFGDSTPSPSSETSASQAFSQPGQALEDFFGDSTPSPSLETPTSSSRGSWEEDLTALFELEPSPSETGEEAAAEAVNLGANWEASENLEASPSESFGDLFETVSDDPDTSDLTNWEGSENLEASPSESFEDLFETVPDDLDTSDLFDSELSFETDSETDLDLDALLDTDLSEDLDPPRELETPPALVPLELLLELEPEFSGPSVFSKLEAYLEEAPGVSMKPKKPAASTIAKSKEDFGDLEKLLEETEKNSGTGGSLKPSRGSEPRRSGRRPQRGGFEHTMRVPIKQLDNLSNLVGELVVSRNSLEEGQERLRQFLDNLLHQVQQLGDVGQRMQDLYERTLLEMALLASRQNRLKASHDDRGEFDALEMDRFTLFHTQAQEIIELIVRVRESASDIEFLVAENDQVTRQLRQTTTQLQEGLTRARMVPFSQTADRLPRGVRDNAIKLGKQVELQVEGQDTLIDKMIQEHLTDPMTHLVNNAIAHGIEFPEERTAKGKPPIGRISVSAFHQGNQTIISVGDDGAGINAEKVKQKALQKGLITQEQAQTMSDPDVYELLFLPGFSIRDTADDLAGRGVGMDVVKTKLGEIRGRVSIDSTLGQGTSFTIRLPLTLSISKALCCISERASIAFPMDGVAEVLDTFPQNRLTEDSKGQVCVPWRDQLVPFRPLRELFTYQRRLSSRYSNTTATDDETIAVVILRAAGTYLGIQVDQVMGEQEIVIKQLEGPVPKPAGIAGATVMGDGRIVPIADVIELIDLSMGRVRREAGGPLWEEESVAPEPIPTKSEPTVLIIDDSITVRELLSMTFKKAGYRVEQARDGQEAWDKLRSGIPCDLVFCDMEMPRMNGMELLSRMHKDSHLNQLPIAMLTSRTAEKHKQMAIELGARGYFTKPYLEEVLLEAAQRLLKGETLVTAKTEA